MSRLVWFGFSAMVLVAATFLTLRVCNGSIPRGDLCIPAHTIPPDVIGVCDFDESSLVCSNLGCFGFVDETVAAGFCAPGIVYNSTAKCIDDESVQVSYDTFDFDCDSTCQCLGLPLFDPLAPEIRVNSCNIE